MIIVREYFTAKPGQASKLANLMKDISAMTSPGESRVMTDLTGEFNRVVMETEAADLNEFEARLKEYASDPEWKRKMSGYTELWITGGREIFKVV
jgi:NIPSNAP